MVMQLDVLVGLQIVIVTNGELAAPKTLPSTQTGMTLLALDVVPGHVVGPAVLPVPVLPVPVLVPDPVVAPVVLLDEPDPPPPPQPAKKRLSKKAAISE